jgi:hypothetical protein
MVVVKGFEPGIAGKQFAHPPGGPKLKKAFGRLLPGLVEAKE